MIGDAVRTRLLVFLTAFYIGGTERQVVNLARGLDRARFEPKLACLRRSGEFLDEVEAQQIPLSEYRIKSLYSPQTFKQQLLLSGNIKRERIEIVHTYNFYPNVFAVPAARLARAPVIVASVRDTGGYETPTQSRLQGFVCRMADCIVANAEAVRQRLIVEGYSPQKITVIRNGVDLKRFAGNCEGAKLRKDLGLPAHAPVVAMLSRLVRQKGVEDFLEASACVAARVPDTRFLVVGDSPPVRKGSAVVPEAEYRRELESCAARLGLGARVVFTGFRVDVPELLSEVAVSVLPFVSSEGLSNALLESMAAGVPVVATRVGGNAEAIEEGATGLLVPPRDPRALSHAICQVLEDRELALRLGQAGRQRVAEYFSLERMVRETEDLYGTLLREARGR